MVAFLMDHVRQRGIARCGRVSVDEHNNVFIVKGNVPFMPCVAAHIDSVHNWNDVEIVRHDGTLVGLDRNDRQTGIGADDKCGVFICLKLLERFENIAVALFAAEEVGCVGAFKADAKFFDQVGYVMEFDCPGSGILSHSAGGERLFANRGAFIETAMPVLVEHGLIHWQRHPYTDVTALRKRFDLSCLNLSAGYHNWHQSDEFVVLREVSAAIIAGEALIRALGCRRYPYPVGSIDSTEPFIQVTTLNVAERLFYETC
jgi:hypothetical protein